MNDAAKNDLVDPQTGEILPATLTFEQAYQTYKNFVQDNRERNNKNAAISRKLNGEQPWNPKKLKAAGQSWRSNRPTGFMSSLIKRLTPPYKQVVDQLPLLTYSKFPTAEAGSESAQDIFRREITDCIRQWEGWPDFVSQLVEEDICFGYAAVGREDEFSWHPKMHRSDEAMFYAGCPQDASKIKVWALKEDFFIDEIVETVKNVEVATDAGWKVNNLIKKLNTASRQFDDRGNEENARITEDLIRENNLASSFTSTIRVVKAGHLFATNPAGGIDHYIFDRTDGVPLFFRRARYSRMDQCLSVFTAEVGDRTLHGSRGAGRALYNTHVSVEQARNLIQDALHLNGLLLMRRSSKSSSGVSESPGLTVNHPFAIVGENYEVLEKVQFQVDSESFFALDRAATQQAEIAIGAFMPGQILDQGGARRTASEVNYVASIDAQIRAGMLARFADQMFSLVDQLQRRICSAEIISIANEIFMQSTHSGKSAIFDLETWKSLEILENTQDFVYIDIPGYVDRDAVACVIKMLSKGLTPLQIAILANSSSKASVDDAIASQSGILDAVVSRYSADPMIDAVELRRRDIAAKLGANAAERLLNVDLSPMSTLKQQRQQLIELTSMMAGTPMPVDITDEDKVHVDVIISRIAPMLSTDDLGFESVKPFLGMAIQHAELHLESAMKKGVNEKSFSEVGAIIREAKMLLQEATMENQAQQIVSPATSGRAVPAIQASTSVPQKSINLENPPTPETEVASTIEGIANPIRPTPPKSS
jgi:hypothetical protein